MHKDEPFDVFLSHAKPDAEIAKDIGARLIEDAGFKVWFDEWVLVPGETWQPAIAHGIATAKTCAICFGKDTPKGWFREEIQKALNRQVGDASFRVIPVVLPGGDRALIDEFLDLRTWVDFADGVENHEAFHRLKCGVEGVPPGRLEKRQSIADETLDEVREKLRRIRALREESLIDDDIALETQRRLLDVLIEGGN